MSTIFTKTQIESNGTQNTTIPASTTLNRLRRLAGNEIAAKKPIDNSRKNMYQIMEGLDRVSEAFEDNIDVKSIKRNSLSSMDMAKFGLFLDDPYGDGIRLDKIRTPSEGRQAALALVSGEPILGGEELIQAEYADIVNDDANWTKDGRLVGWIVRNMPNTSRHSPTTESTYEAEEKEEMSSCCSAAIDSHDGKHGRCSSCGEMASVVFAESDDDENPHLEISL